MICSFCISNENIDKNTPLCKVCLNALDQKMAPPIAFKEFFSSGLEKKLKEVDSLLFSLPENYFLWYLKGHLEHELGESKKALRSINTSITYKDDFGDSWVRLGLIYSDMHKESDAIENFKRGLKFPLIDPSNLVDAGVSLQASDQPKLAAMVLQRALDLVSDDDRAMVALAKVLFQTGELSEAKDIMDRAVDLYPHNEEVLRAMAQIMMKLGDLDPALDMYSRILDQHPRDFEALLAKGEIHLKKGELHQSLKSYKAVRDLDIHISWSGILRFIVSTISELLETNENQPSYREDLKKEYENIQLFLKETEGKLDSAVGPEMLDEIETLIKVLENMRISLKEQIGQFEDLLKKFKVDDSFHKHLRGKVADLRIYLAAMRYFDGKQISLELSPFLSDLKTMDTRTEARLKEELEKRFDELEEVGLGNPRLKSRIKEVISLEKEGNFEGATFMLKEIQISLDEYWNEVGKEYFEGKRSEMEELLEKGKGQFDTSRLKRKYEEFRTAFKRGPTAVREGYLDFTKAYSEDSENFYSREVERTLREIEYKIVILEKDGKDVKDRSKVLKKLRKRLDSGIDPREIHIEAEALLNNVSHLELEQKASDIRGKLKIVDRLLSDVDTLGMDEEISRNVEPVRRVIERSLKNENYKLAEILTGEVQENIEKLLKENYIEDLKESMYDSLSELERLKELGVEDSNWEALMEMARSKLETDEVPGPLIPIVSCLADLQTHIQDFYIERLSVETEHRIKVLKNLLKEGERYEFDLEWDRKVVTDLERRADEISSLEMLEEVVSLEADLERKIRDLLSDKVEEYNASIRRDVEKLIEIGGTQKDLMEVLSHANRAEVLLESNSERDAFRSILASTHELETVKERFFKRTADSLFDHIGATLSSAEQIGLDMSDMKKEYQSLKRSRKNITEEKMVTLKRLQESTWESYNQGVLEIFDDHDATVEDLISQTKGLFPENEIKVIKDQIAALENAIRNGDLEAIPKEIEKSGSMLDEATEKAKERAYLAKCSLIIENGILMDDERAKEIVKEAQDLAKRIKEKGAEGVKDEISRLQKDLSDLRSIVHIQTIEKMLSDIEDLDDLAKELFDLVEGEEFEAPIKEISKSIKKLIDSTPSLYKSPEPIKLDQMSISIEGVKKEIISLENRWRAKKRLQTLEEMGAFEIEVGDKLLQRDLQSLKELYSNGDHQKFFRVWERIEGQMDKIKRQIMILKPGIGEEEDKGREVLVRAKGPKSSSQGRAPGRSGGMGGIQKLARDMGEKRKLMDGGRKTDIDGSKKGIPKEPDEEAAAGKTGDQEGSIAEGTQEVAKNIDPKDLAGIAKLIAGDRIKKLEEKGSMSTKGGAEGPAKEDGKGLIWTKNRHRDVSNLSSIMDEAIEIDKQKQTSSDPMNNAVKAKERLETFYGKLPENLRLDESMSFYVRGLACLQKGDHVNALKEFRLAISSAVKVTKLHTEISKALSNIDKELSIRRRKGEPNQKAEKVFHKAENALLEGDLAECATMIKEMKNELF